MCLQIGLTGPGGSSSPLTPHHVFIVLANGEGRLHAPPPPGSFVEETQALEDVVPSVDSQTFIENHMSLFQGHHAGIVFANAWL